LAPGSTIGILGGGQLGRMMALAAARIGYQCHILDPHERPCAAEVSAHFTRAAFDDEDALRRFAETCDVVTYEFENLPAGPLKLLGDQLRPGVKSLVVAQDRAKEKSFIESTGGRVAPWRSIASLDEVKAAIAELGLPLVLKTRRYGYDGKGQAWIRSGAGAEAAWETIGRQPAVAEAGIDFAAEFSIVLARADGGCVSFEATENEHKDGILRHSTVPARQVVLDQAEEAREMAVQIADALGHVGVLTIEFFATSGGPLVNEIAPRVHNSGHWTIEGAHTSQFEQHLRAILGLPLGDPSPVGKGAAMENLIGPDIERWANYVAEPGAYLHLYNKGEARPGRKMGHVTRLR
jgi:5-(carboxyamino)imidazole ribonucleotide synthase